MAGLRFSDMIVNSVVNFVSLCCIGFLLVVTCLFWVGIYV